MFLGLAAGFAVGSGFVAFLAVLGIIPRLMQLSKTMKMVIAYEWAVILGTIAGGMGSLWNPSLMLPPWIMIPIGAACGIFVGMMAAALTEVLNVFPILTKRIGIDEKIVILMTAFVLGKIAGSLFQWLYFDSG
jgi:stage V sporulation protein AB